MAVITVNSTGGADYITIADAITNANDFDVIEIQDSAVYDEFFPNNINIGNLTFRSNRTDVDAMPTIRLTGAYFNWWSNVQGTRNFEKVKFGDFVINPIGTASNRILNVYKCFADGNTESLFYLGDASTQDRVKIDSSIFINCTGIVFNQNSSTNYDVRPATVFNSVFYNCSEITNNTINPGQQRFVQITNSILHNNTVNCADVDVLEKWMNNYSNDTTGWGINNISSGGTDPFVNLGGSNPSDYKLNSSSLAIGAGTSTGAPTEDISDTVWNEFVDMGAWAIDQVTQNPPDFKSIQYPGWVPVGNVQSALDNQAVGRDLVLNNENCITQDGVVLVATKRSV